MLSEPEYILGVRGGSHSLMLLEPESILGVMGGGARVYAARARV